MMSWLMLKCVENGKVKLIVGARTLICCPLRDWVAVRAARVAMATRRCPGAGRGTSIAFSESLGVASVAQQSRWTQHALHSLSLSSSRAAQCTRDSLTPTLAGRGLGRAPLRQPPSPMDCHFAGLCQFFTAFFHRSQSSFAFGYWRTCFYIGVWSTIIILCGYTLGGVINYVIDSVLNRQEWELAVLGDCKSIIMDSLCGPAAKWSWLMCKIATLFFSVYCRIFLHSRWSFLIISGVPP